MTVMTPLSPGAPLIAMGIGLLTVLCVWWRARAKTRKPPGDPCHARAAISKCRAFATQEGHPMADEAYLLARDLCGAIVRGELHLQFQPKIDARRGVVTAVEALLRWTHPERGEVPPLVFIPIAERFDFMDEIGEWVIEEVCRQASMWRAKGLGLRIAVNIAQCQLLKENFPERTRCILRHYGIRPSLLTCEITQSPLLENAKVCQQALMKIDEGGMLISIDGFRMGHSSLGCLPGFPVREIKIDRSLVAALGESKHADFLVRTVIRMSHALGKRVVAQGVENRRQMEMLVDLGCDELQGYFFAKPMSSELLLLWASSAPYGAPCFNFRGMGRDNFDFLIV